MDLNEFYRPMIVLSSIGILSSIVGCSSMERNTADEALRGGAGNAVASIEGLRTTDAQANVFTSSTQGNTAIDLTEGGNVVAVWESRRQQEGQYGVYARVLNANGYALTPEVQINDFALGHQTHPAVAVAADGSAWFVWASSTDDDLGRAIVARRFDALLQPLTDEIVVNSERTGQHGRPAIATTPDGRALVAWTVRGASSRTQEVRGRLFDSDGTPIGDAFAVGAEADVHHMLPAIAAVGDEGFILAWSRATVASVSAQPTYEIIARRIDRQGVPVGDMITVNPNDGATHVEPSIDALDDGRFAVAWMRASEADYGVMYRAFGAAGKATSPMTALTDDGVWRSGAGIALDAQGRAFVTWNQASAADAPADGDRLGVMASIVSPKGGIERPPFVVNQTTDGLQYLQIASNARRVAWNGQGVIAVGWNGDGGASDDSAAIVSLFTPENVVAQRPDSKRLAMVVEAQEIAPIPPIKQKYRKLPPPAGTDGAGPDFGFNAIDFTGWTPPDPEIAVGPNHLVGIINGAIAFFDKQGNLLFQDEIEDSFGFWGAQGATGFVFDPEALWDPHSNRFFAMANERGSDGRSYFLLAVSDDEDPNGTWFKYRILDTTDNDIDSPNMAIDDSVVYLTADFFGPDKYGIKMIEKAPLLSGGAVNQRNLTITGSGNQSMGVPIIHDANAPAGYLIQSSEGTGNGLGFNELRFHAIQNQLTSPTRVSVDVPVPTYSFPTQPPQQGTSNRPFLFEPRFWSTTYINGSLWAVHHIGNPVRARWYEFEMNGWPDSGVSPTMRQWGEIQPGSGIHTYFPSIAVDQDENAVILFSRSSSNEFISIGRAFRRASDPLGTFRPMEFVQESTSPYVAANRWGDYSHIELDPASPGDFWGMHEWTDVSTAWRTWIVQVKTGQPVAEIVDAQVTFGQFIEGDVSDLVDSDDNEFVGRSAFGFSAQEPNMLRIVVDYVADPGLNSLTITTESRLNNPGGRALVRLFRWGANEFRQRDNFSIGQTDVVNVTEIADGTPFVNGQGQLRLQLQYSVLATFSASGFDAFVDQTEIAYE